MEMNKAPVFRADVKLESESLHQWMELCFEGPKESKGIFAALAEMDTTDKRRGAIE